MASFFNLANQLYADNLLSHQLLSNRLNRWLNNRLNHGFSWLGYIHLSSSGSRFSYRSRCRILSCGSISLWRYGRFRSLSNLGLMIDMVFVMLYLSLCFSFYRFGLDNFNILNLNCQRNCFFNNLPEHILSPEIHYADHSAYHYRISLLISYKTIISKCKNRLLSTVACF